MTNEVAVNVIIIGVAVYGLVSAFNIQQEVFPDIEFDYVTVGVVYPGASPNEVESAICLPLEEAVADQDGVGELKCTSYEGSASFSIEVEDGFDPDQLLQDVRTYVSRIITFPEEAEEPVVQRSVRRRQLVSLVVHGKATLKQIYSYAELLRDRLSELPGISQITLPDIPDHELIVNVEPKQLLSHRLSLQEIAAKISGSSLDLPGGSVQMQDSQVLLRTDERRTNVKELENLIISSDRKGNVLRLGEIAKIFRGFEQTDGFAQFDGNPSARVNVFQDEDETPIGLSRKVTAFLAQFESKLPSSIKVSMWSDRSEYFASRFSLLIKNAIFGFLLVLLTLTLFLELRLAFWAVIGMSASFLGALIFLPALGVTINMISMFAFILVLGIVVDDAIIVGERIYQKREQGMDPMRASVVGCLEMSTPVFYAIISTVVAFIPLLFIEGSMGKFLYSIPVIVISILLLSLCESIFILPCHLKSIRIRKSSGSSRPIRHVLLQRFVTRYYRALIVKCLRNRWTTIAVAFGILIFSISLVLGGRVGVRFFPSIERDEISVNFELPPGFPPEKAKGLVDSIEAVGRRIAADLDAEFKNTESDLLHIYSEMKNFSRDSGTSVGIRARLKDAEIRKISGDEFSKRWRQEIPKMPEVSNLEVSAHWGHWGADIHIDLGHEDPQVLAEIVEATKKELAKYRVVDDIKDSQTLGKPEMHFRLSPEAIRLGITPSNFAQEIRAAFHGVIVDRFTEGRNEVSVRLRIPDHPGKQLELLDSLLIKTPSGGHIPLSQSVVVEREQGPSRSTRIRQKRVTSVTASVDKVKRDPQSIIDQLKDGFFSEWQKRYSGLYIAYEGAQKERRRSTRSLFGGFCLALFLIYALLAILFRSYRQPILVMAAIPFGLVGAIMGHGLLGHPLSFLSFFGIVGLSGVVVNDSLILITTVNAYIAQGKPQVSAIIAAGQSRFRPIMLTSLTTFAGTAPILMERSRQAQYLIPMAISLGVGILFATLITLVLVPVLSTFVRSPSHPENEVSIPS